LVLGAALKSAQLPFHSLIQAMEASTPASALCHAGAGQPGWLADEPEMQP
jgi:NADH:ubiquinone oxidoreductase subunit 5 (subunit L)/multisubunit Na+/H+ antiporter MnhA subunit